MGDPVARVPHVLAAVIKNIDGEALVSGLSKRGFAISSGSSCTPDQVWNKSDELVGGLYGVEVRGLFAGESMFHKETDASKTAMVYLVNKLKEAGGERIFDVQWQTPHLKSMGVIKIPRSKYLSLLPEVMKTKPAF